MQRPLLQTDSNKANCEEEGSCYTYMKNMIESFKNSEKENKQEYKIHMNGKIHPKEIKNKNRVNVIKYRMYIDQLREYRWLYFLTVILIGQLDSYMTVYSYILFLYIFYVFLNDTYKLVTAFQLQKTINRQIYKFSKNIWFFYKYQDIEVGHLLEISQNQVIPNDMVILYSDNKQIFLEDEEGKLSQKRSLVTTQSFMDKDPMNNKIHDLNYYLLVKRDGSMCLVNKSSYGQQAQEIVQGQNTMAKYHRLVSQQPVFAMVIKNWNEVQANSQPTKQNSLQTIIKTQLPILLIVLIVMSLIGQHYFQQTLSSPYQLILLVSFNLLVSLDLSLILLDQYLRRAAKGNGSLSECQLNNGNLISKLEEVDYMLINESGSIRKEKGRVKVLVIDDQMYSALELKLMKSLLKGVNCSDSQLALEGLLEAILVNNCVKGNKYSCDALDSVFLELAASLKYKLLEKDDEQVRFIIEHKDNMIQHYKILYAFQTSQRHLTIIYDFDNQYYVLFTKGSYSAMKSVMTESSIEQADNLKESQEESHIHYMYFGKRVLSEEDFIKFDSKYKEGQRLGLTQKQLEEKLIKKIERKINMIGAIGVEESVTFKAKETLSVMKDKGIKPWLITHQGQEQTYLLAKQLSLINKDTKVYSMCNLNEFIQIQNHLNELDTKQGQCVLLIDYSSLKQSLRFHKRFFFEVSSQAPCVLLAEVCGSLSSIQKLKESLVRKLKEVTSKSVMAVGSTYQDLSMLQRSDLGIAIGNNKLCRLTSDVQVPSIDALIPLATQYAPIYKHKALQLISWSIARSTLVTMVHLGLFYRHGLSSQQHTYFTIMHSGLALFFSLQALIHDKKVSTLNSLSTKVTLILSLLQAFYQLAILLVFTQSLSFSQAQQVVLICLSLLCLDVFNLIARITQVSAVSCIYILVILVLHSIFFPLFFNDFYSLFQKELITKLLQIVAICFLPVYFVRKILSCYQNK